MASASGNWSGDSRFSLIMNVSESYVSGGAENYSNVDWNLQLKSTSSYRTYTNYAKNPLVAYVDGQQVFNQNIAYDLQNNTVTVASGTVRVYHNSDGTKTIGFSASFTDNSNGKGSASCSSSMGLTTIGRYAVTNSVSGSNIESNFSVNYTKYSNSFSYKLRISIPNVVMLERIDYNTSGASFSLSQTTIDNLLNRYNTTNNVPLGFAVETYSGGTKLSDGNEIKITGKIVNANPVFTDFEYEDINATTLALTGDSSINVNGYSTIKATISTTNKATAIKSATMSKYRFIIGDTSSDVSYSDDSTVEITIPNAKNGTYNMYAIDSRQNSTLVTKLASNEINYTPISLNASSLSATRDSSGVGTNCTLHFEGTFWNNSFGQETNSITSVSYRFKKTSSSTWETGPTTITLTITDDTFSFTGTIGTNNQGYSWDLGDSYNIEITISDELSTITKEVILMSAVPTLALSKNGVGIMGKYDDNVGGLLQVGGEKVNLTDVYSTSEIKTNKVWIDGSPIYRKVVSVDFPTNSNATASTYHNISNISIITHFWLMWYDSTDQAWYNYYKDTSGSYYVQIDNVTSTVVRVKANNTAVNWNARTRHKYAIIEYTKSS